jgi:hypothetical protein
MQTCLQLDAIIIPSCSSLVLSNNVLTVEGERVKGCIQNGLALAGGGTFLIQKEENKKRKGVGLVGWLVEI